MPQITSISHTALRKNFPYRILKPFVVSLKTLSKGKVKPTKGFTPSPSIHCLNFVHYVLSAMAVYRGYFVSELKKKIKKTLQCNELNYICERINQLIIKI